jgi:calcineurin-like phosphoesterase
MCGPVNSILGRAIEPIMNRFISNLPASFPVAGGEVRLRGALIEIDEATGRAVRINRVDEPGPGESAPPEPEPKIDIEQAPSPEQT